MFAVAGGPSFAGSPLTWNLLFARQPEPDLEFTEEELEQTTNVRSSSAMKPPKKSGGRQLLWLLLLLLVGGGAYVAMEPEIVTDLLGPLLGESSAPPRTARPAPSLPKPSGPTSQPDSAHEATSRPSVPAPQTAVPSPVPPPAPAPTPSASIPTTPASPAPGDMPAPIQSATSPLFGEGQKVTAMFNPTAPGDPIALTQDPAGMKPGPAVPPGTALTILDGDLQSSGWVYSVRSDDGAKGWIPEKRLRLKP
jgi:hypothetical protein